MGHTALLPSNLQHDQYRLTQDLRLDEFQTDLERKEPKTEHVSSTSRHIQFEGQLKSSSSTSQHPMHDCRG